MNFNNFMTLTAYVFGAGLLVFGIRNGDKVAAAIGGVWNAGTKVVHDIGTIT